VAQPGSPVAARALGGSAQLSDSWASAAQRGGQYAAVASTDGFRLLLLLQQQQQQAPGRHDGSVFSGQRDAAFDAAARQLAALRLAETQQQKKKLLHRAYGTPQRIM
jgi:hypothetical protein